MKEKIKYVVIVLLIITLSVVVSLITNLIVKDNNKETKCDDTKVQENIADKNLDLVFKLYDSLVSYDNSYSVHQKEKVTINDIDNIELIKFHVNKYLFDEGINISTGEDEEKELYRFEKSDLNEYINNKYKVNNKYDNNSLRFCNYEEEDCYGSPMQGTTTLFSDDSEWLLMNEARSGGGDYINHKFVSYEIVGDNLYIYDKYIHCMEDFDGATCNKILTNVYFEEMVIDCAGEDADEFNAENCPLNAYASMEELAEYALENMSDKLNTYKHTFKKIDGKYYWYSSEIVK